MRKALLAVLTCALAATPALASSPWDGTWKLDQSKSNFGGSTFTYAKTADGKMRYSDGSPVTVDFTLDGQPSATPYGDTITWHQVDPHTWQSVDKHGDAVTSTNTHTISPDGKTQTVTSTGTRPDGSTFNDSVTYTRVSGASGLEGTWRSTKVSMSAPGTWVVSSPSDGVFHYEFPEFKETVEGKPDGSDLAITGPQVPDGMTVAITMQSPTALSYVVKLKGKAIQQGTQTLATDGQSFTDVSWTPGKESEKQTAFYGKS